MPLRLLPQESRPFDVVGLGENSADLLTVVAHYPERNSKQQIRQCLEMPGGQVATAMVACARLGWRARYVGRFGDDERGASGLASLRAEGVDVSAVEIVRGVASRFAVILIDEDTRGRTVLWSRDERLRVSADDVSLDTATSGRVLHLDGSDPGVATAAARAAQASGVRTTGDIESVAPGVDALLAHIDVIIVAEDFPSAFTGYSDTGRALAALEQAYPHAILCVTLAEEGSVARCAGREIRTGGFRVACLDSTGAGDVFRAGFISRWLAAGDAAVLEDVLAYANAAAALSCRALGGRGALPGAAEVEELLETR